MPEVILSDSIECKFNEDENNYDFNDFKFDEALNDFFTLAKTSVTSDVKAKIEKDLRFHSNKCYEKMNYPNQPPVLELFLSVETSDFVNIIKKHMGNPVVKLDD